jgi:hypothetical protein
MVSFCSPVLRTRERLSKREREGVRKRQRGGVRKRERERMSAHILLDIVLSYPLSVKFLGV